MVDTLGSGSSVRADVLVRVQFWAKKDKFATQACLFLYLEELARSEAAARILGAQICRDCVLLYCLAIKAAPKA